MFGKLTKVLRNFLIQNKQRKEAPGSETPKYARNENGGCFAIKAIKKFKKYFHKFRSDSKETLRRDLTNF